MSKVATNCPRLLPATAPSPLLPISVNKTSSLPTPPSPRAAQDRNTGVFLVSSFQPILTPGRANSTTHTSLKSIVSLSVYLHLSISLCISRSLCISVSLCSSIPLSWFPFAPKIKSHFLTLWGQFPPPPLHPGSLDFFHIHDACCSLPNHPSHSPCN